MKIDERNEAIKLRKDGYSLKEIAFRLDVAKSSVSMWVRDVELSPAAESRLLGKIKLGQFNAAKNKRARTKAVEDGYLKSAREALGKLVIAGDHAKLLCAAMYWCEGAKSNKSGINFTNSDPDLIKAFLALFRQSFSLDEKRFRPCIHLHSYHNAATQLDFWSKITDISKEQFIKPHIKPNSGKRIHHGYQGCIAVRYHSNDIARRLNAFAKAFLLKTGGIGSTANRPPPKRLFRVRILVPPQHCKCHRNKIY